MKLLSAVFLLFIVSCNNNEEIKRTQTELTQTETKYNAVRKTIDSYDAFGDTVSTKIKNDLFYFYNRIDSLQKRLKELDPNYDIKGHSTMDMDSFNRDIRKDSLKRAINGY